MKKYIILILSVLLTLSLFGCAEKPTEDTSTAVETDIWGITLSTENVTPSGMTLKIIQSGGEFEGELEYGSDFTLEVRQNQEWVTVEPQKDVAWTLVAFMLPENQTTKLDINWNFIYGELPAGHYRLCKEFMDFIDTGKYTTRTYYAEFTLY